MDALDPPRSMYMTHDSVRKCFILKVQNLMCYVTDFWYNLNKDIAER